MEKQESPRVKRREKGQKTLEDEKKENESGINNIERIHLNFLLVNLKKCLLVLLISSNRIVVQSASKFPHYEKQQQFKKIQNTQHIKHHKERKHEVMNKHTEH